MTNEQINQAIAEHLGWTRTEIRDCSGRWNDTEPQRMAVIGVRPSKCYVVNPYKTETPDYCNDLNAMHEAEMACSEHTSDQMREALIRIRWRDRPNGTPRELSPIHATAIERAEAFLRTVGKWEENL